MLEQTNPLKMNRRRIDRRIGYVLQKSGDMQLTVFEPVLLKSRGSMTRTAHTLLNCRKPLPEPPPTLKFLKSQLFNRHHRHAVVNAYQTKKNSPISAHKAEQDPVEPSGAPAQAPPGCKADGEY